MAFKPYVPLRIHTEYSLVDGMIRPKKLPGQLSAIGIAAAAITDKDNVFGAFKFSNACEDEGIQPIIGCDLSVRMGVTESDPVDRITLVCTGSEGYRNLSLMLTQAQMAKAQGVPVVSGQMLKDHGQGLIALTGDGDTHLAALQAKGDRRAAREYIKALRDIYGDRLYLEISRDPLSTRRSVVNETVRIANAAGLGVVAVNPAYFVDESDHEPHAVRVAVARGEVLGAADQMGFSRNARLMSPKEMSDLFSDIPGALDNSVEIAKKCAFSLRRQTPCLPAYPDAQKSGLDEPAYLRKRASDGLSALLPTLLERNPKNTADEYRQRINHELDVIEKMGFPGYFLIVADFIQWAKDNDIPVGPGRGSGAGSLVAYALTITNLDPLKYDLLFERFLNPERVSMPDFDIDFCMDNRDKVIEYVSEKYGRERVSRIITFGRMQARGAIRDTARALGYPYFVGDGLAKQIPPDPDMTLQRALSESEGLNELLGKDRDSATVFEQAQKIEGLARNAGKHAGGIIIAPTVLSDFVPAFVDGDSGHVATQFDMNDSEAVGLVKFDFLGLRTLTIINEAVKSVREFGPPDFDIDEIDLEDAGTFALLQRCETTSVFQLESSGMKDLINRLQPETFEEIVALVALFRPGPLESGMVDDFVDRKHGRIPVEYPHPDLEEILKPTYGVILYQEQVMQIAQVLAGYSLGEADLLRRAMGKKKPEEMAKQRSIFVGGATGRGVEASTATAIFDLMEKFAGYGFNKSHSAAYALIAYQTAFLKAHYPAEFLAATLSADMGKTDKLAIVLRDAKAMDIEVLPPDVNQGIRRFMPLAERHSRPNSISYGLAAIKGLGESLADHIANDRRVNGQYRSMSELGSRLAGEVSSKSLKQLVASGACDSMGLSRRQLDEEVGDALKSGKQQKASAESGQSDMFGLAAEQAPARPARVPEWDERERLEREFDALGLYISGHPTDPYSDELAQVTTSSVGELLASFETNPPRGEEGRPCVVGGFISGRRDVRGHVFLSIEDADGAVDVAVFSRTFATCRETLSDNKIVVIRGFAKEDSYTGGYSIIADAVMTLEDAIQARMDTGRGVPAAAGFGN